jgi:hypothetical protein
MASGIHSFLAFKALIECDARAVETHIGRPARPAPKGRCKLCFRREKHLRKFYGRESVDIREKEPFFVLDYDLSKAHDEFPQSLSNN